MGFRIGPSPVEDFQQRLVFFQFDGIEAVSYTHLGSVSIPLRAVWNILWGTGNEAGLVRLFQIMEYFIQRSVRRLDVSQA